ncbi:MAG: 2-oxo acid dehydrogenase subunit, partial [Sphingomonas bacterium]|nr:2-oxo acid dehydrogenase subunit [Sphingomonas bacterium]
MARFEFRLPDIGEGIAEAEIVAWHVKVGDAVSEDQQLADMMTDKATVEMESPVAGTVIELAGEVGDQVPIGSTLVVIEVEGDAPAAEEPKKDIAEDVAEQLGATDEETVEAENPGVADAEGKTPAYEAPSPSPLRGEGR